VNFSSKILVFSIVFLNVFVLKAQRADVIYGLILNQQDSSPVINAHIFNLNSNRGVVSNLEGKFSIEVKSNDTLQISIIGFESKKVTNSQVIKNIYLKRKNYEIEFKEFKKAFVKLELKDGLPQVNQSIFLSKEELRSYDGSSGAVGGISAILGHFNKYVQDKKKYDRLIKKDQLEARLAKKFTPQLVKNATSLKNSATIQSFMEYCDFTNSFIDHSSEYELTIQIIKCYNEFNSLTISD